MEMILCLCVSALLNQQMQRQLMLRDEYNREFRMLDGLRTNVGELEASLTQRQVTLRFVTKIQFSVQSLLVDFSF